MKYVSSKEKRKLQKELVVKENLQEVKMNLHQAKWFGKAKKGTNEFRRKQWTWSSDILVLTAPILLFNRNQSLYTHRDIFCHNFAKYYRNQGKVKEQRVFRDCKKLNLESSLRKTNV